MRDKLLEVQDLRIKFKTDNKIVPVVHGISFSIQAGETLGLVGESGCGKSVTSLAIMQLLDTPPAIYDNGQILINGENLLEKSEAEMEKIRGKEISMIFQEPMTSLNPVVTIGAQIDEIILIHNPISKAEAKARSIEMLRKVKVPGPEQVYHKYPFELSGGMRQRVMIAIALACNPRLLIADEPTTALDVTIQAQILKLMRELKDNMNTAILFITHDLGVVANMCDRVAVMYSGELVEEADTVSLFKDSKHPYTRGLLASIPRIGRRNQRLTTIKGQVPAPGSILQGCKFADRCDDVMAVCREQAPTVHHFSDSHRCQCWKYAEAKPGVGRESHG